MPIENSLEGAVNATLDALALDAHDVAIVGEARAADPPLPDRARAGSRSSDDRAVVSHPAGRWRSARASCATRCRGAALRAATSTAEAVRAGRRGATRAVGRARAPGCAAELYGCARPARGRRGRARQRDALRLARARRRRRRRRARAAVEDSVVFWGAGDARPGWLVRCLSEFAFRGVNLTRIESRPRSARPRPLHVPRRPRGPRRRAAASPTRSRRCARTARTSACSGSYPARDRALRRDGRSAAPATLPRRSRHGSVTPPGPRGSAPLDGHRRRGRERGRVLVLNATYEPINVCTVRRAAVLLLKEKAEIVEHAAGSCAPSARRCRGRS